MRGFLIVLATGMGAHALLTMANLYKISINGMPITALDIHITTANPDALWQSLGIAVWLGWLITGLAVGALAFTLLMLARRLRHLTLVSCASILATLSLTATVGDFYSEKMFVYVKNLQAANHEAMWSNQRVSALSKGMGSIPFLIYSWKLEQEAGAEFFKHSLNEQDIPAASLSENYKKHFQRHVGLKPNIVMIQLESIFNPNTAFELDRKISSSLFEENQYSHLVGPMQVNIIGGGSWVSEFEAINGLDSRLFGYSGYYTHVTIAPYINGSFPKHLHGHGYSTFAFYPTYGLFYNVGSAYRRYGFEEFRDWKDLKLSQDWAAADSEVAAAFVKGSLDFDSSKPFFSYIVTAGAHSPYTCRNFESSSSFMATFKSSDDWGMNCDLNEYLLLLRDSEKAVDLVLDRLKSIEKDTGRPFVLLIYGDHQPYSFTKTWQFAGSRDYDAVRTSAPKNQTFMHLMSSTSRTIKNLEGEKPVTLLPTLLSSFVADGAEDMYLLGNVYLFDQCGPDLFEGVKTAGLFGGDTAPGMTANSHFNPTTRDPSSISPGCQAAQRQTIANQRRSGIVSIGAR